MKTVQRNVLKSLRDRIDVATKQIENDKSDITYQHQIIQESKELIKKLLGQKKEEHDETKQVESDDMQNM
jgi:hypothetical protein